ncbi:hypothetical protein Q1W73_15315 [Asticcacaulis sp. ZE23SCel15]|jgi:hypothetical protein|nr:hypothetical protein [Asticcacaulis sp. ZE23SCel15]WKL57014.1 hypothetical protein Q1W73_15315 [Asticcacaulis sp. ZE23SCel15]
MSHSNALIATRSRPAAALSVNDIEQIARICALGVAGVMGLGLFILMAL